MRSLGHGEDTLLETGSKSYGPSRTTGTRWEGNPFKVYDQVMIAAKYSQEDYRLDSLIDGIEKEYVFNLMYQCTFMINL